MPKTGTMPATTAEFKQPKALNRFVDDSIPLTWNFRWRSFKRIIPFLVFCCALSVEAVGLGWLKNPTSETPILWPLLVGGIFPLIFLPLMIEVTVRMSHLTERILKIDHKGLLLRHTRAYRIHWSCLKEITLEPIAEMPAYAKLEIRYSLSGKSKVLRKWPMVLHRTNDVPLLAVALKNLSTNPILVQELEHARPRERPRATPNFAIYLLGTFLLVHGLPLIAVSWPGSRAAAKSERSAELPVSVQRFLVQHFRSGVEIENALLWTGGVLTASGVLFLVWGSRVLRRGSLKSHAAPDDVMRAPLPESHQE